MCITGFGSVLCRCSLQSGSRRPTRRVDRARIYLARTRMRFNAEDLLGDYQVTFVDGLWIALVAVEAGIIVCVLVSRILQARKRKAREGFFFSTLPS
ncbi:hypothetical protein F4680DRAFT_393198 [Xylaria scruposa]|nr:hypothetical protein F4680DRAFT_393198 [Xylaria scruposa]